LGPSIEPAKTLDDESVASLDSYEGMSIVDFIVLPHYEAEDPAYKTILDTYSSKYKLLPLTDQQFVLATEEGYEVIQ
jgi:peptidase E